MQQSYFFYDLETSGLDPRTHRVMQFAGRRTTLEFEPIGEPFNVLVRLTDDILPDPAAVMITGITPQMTLADGMSEREFCRMLVDEVFLPGTIVTGFNSVRFDDEFIRHTLWRNFFDPYEWAWAEGRSRWDMLDVVRMTRALRPDGIEWPVVDGKPANRLELIAAANGLDHAKAHDALSDVDALIQVAKLIRSHQPKLYDYMLEMRNKRKVQELVSLDDPRPFVYSSGRYDNEWEKTTIAMPVALSSKPGAVVVYDLRHDPDSFAELSVSDIATRLFGSRDDVAETGRFPAKELTYTRCPAVAPLGVVDEAAWKRIGLTLETVTKHYTALAANTQLRQKIADAFAQRAPYPPATDVEAKLYDGFVSDQDKLKMSAVRAADVATLRNFGPQFADKRLPELLLRYKARQFPESLTDDERTTWEERRGAVLQAALPRYVSELQRLAPTVTDTYLLEELQLWAESIMPSF
jgi:exodeoxyribonuclease I